MMSRVCHQSIYKTCRQQVWKPAVLSCVSPSIFSYNRNVSVLLSGRNVDQKRFFADSPNPSLPSTAALSDRVSKQLELMEDPTCTGCGIPVQFTDQSKVGFVPPGALEKSENLWEVTSKILCQRCYNIRHYGKVLDAKIADSDYENEVLKLKGRDLLVLHLIDPLDIEGSLLPKSRHIFGNKDVILVVNKGDLLPENSGMRRIKRKISQDVKELKIDNIVGVHLISATKRIGLNNLVRDIKKFRKHRDICVVGAANVGKSSFLNALGNYFGKDDAMRYGKLKKTQVLEEVLPSELTHEDEVRLFAEAPVRKTEQKNNMNDNESMTTSCFPGTTLAIRPVAMPFSFLKNESVDVYDTPGIIVDANRQRLIEILLRTGLDQLLKSIPSKKLPMTPYRMQHGRSLFLGGLVRIDYETKGNEKLNNVIFCWHGVLPGHQTKTLNANEVYIKHAGGLIAPPRGLDSVSLIGELKDRRTINLCDYYVAALEQRSKVKKPKRTSVLDIVFPGFGWLTVSAIDLDGSEGAKRTILDGIIKIKSCDGFDSFPRTPIFPYEASGVTKAKWKDM